MDFFLVGKEIKIIIWEEILQQLVEDKSDCLIALSNMPELLEQ